MAFAINSAPFEPAISVRKHWSLNTTKRPLKGPTAQGCKPLFPSTTPSAPRGLHTQPPPPPPAVHSRLGSRSAREGHNSSSIGGGARPLPPRARKGRERREWGRGARAGQWRPRPRPLHPRGTGGVCAWQREGASWQKETSTLARDFSRRQAHRRQWGAHQGLEAAGPSLSGAGLSALGAAGLPGALRLCVRSFPVGSAAGEASQ